MPVHDYHCDRCGSRTEVVYLMREDVRDDVPCDYCVGSARKSDVNRFRIVGPVWDKLDVYNRNLLKTDERRQGMEFKSHKDVERYEAAAGLRQIDPASVEYRRNRDAQMDEARMYETRRDRDGTDAAFAHMDKVDIQAKTGMSDASYSRYKEASDACPAPKS
jgi:hypothetical protein